MFTINIGKKRSLYSGNEEESIHVNQIHLTILNDSHWNTLKFQVEMSDNWFFFLIQIASGVKQKGNTIFLLIHIQNGH